ncbi:MAG: acyl-CoA dehydrogenase [Proteobacteria bacterium]|nr:acyl-CoA dehydrogenase [Pseudomonadota bacterium]
MSDKYISMKNLRFLLYDVHNIQDLTEHAYYQDHDRETFDLVLDTAEKIGTDLLYPYHDEMDKNPPEFSDGKVSVHPHVRKIMKEFGEGEWYAADFPYDAGGQQLPVSISAAIGVIFAAANMGAGYQMLSSAAARLITTFGNQTLIDKYVPHMLSGRWQGTMAMTEPQAGSSLTDLKTQAIPTDEGYYHIRGGKVFISAGDHDGVDNIVHLLLAKVKGAPAGVKGISLFVVPKLRPEDNGELVPNDVSTIGIFHKLGIKVIPTTQLSFGDNGDCRGYLVGELNQGLTCMFQMMNEARIGVGMGAAAIASAAYYASLEYAQERPQGRSVTNRDPESPQVRIIEHADVKRMLLFQRAVVEGSLSLGIQCARYADLEIAAEGEEKERSALLLDLLTPIVKTYPSEMAIHSVSQGMQILGGSGYCDEYPLEKYYRDARLNPIHEGTTGIQGMDLLGRKVLMKGGKAFELYLQELQTSIDAAREVEALQPYAEQLAGAMKTLKEVTSGLLSVGAKDPEVFVADATLYLEFFGLITVAWQWLLQGVKIQEALAQELSESEDNFYQGKMSTCQFYFHYELPKILGLAPRLREADGMTVRMKEEHFED